VVANPDGGQANIFTTRALVQVLGEAHFPAFISASGKIPSCDLFDVADGVQLSMFEPQGEVAQPGDGRHVVAHEQYSAPRTAHLTHLPEALFLEGSIADRQHLVHQ
jgi:hypothetical protein